MSTYLKLASELEQLRKKTERARRSEVGAVIKNIKAQIKRYGLVASDLGLSAGTKDKPGAKPGRKPTSSSRKKGTKVAPRYSDGTNTWTGRGKTPGWVKAAIDAGATIESLRLSET